VGKGNFFWQSESGAVHVGFRGHISNIVKTDNILLAELWPVHCLPDPLDKKLESVLLFFFISKAINVNQWKLNFALVRCLPDERIRFIEKTNEYV
jgi:hypothetical protein